MTLDEIGQLFEVTRERIRQIESKALRFLQNRQRMAKIYEQIHGKPDSYYAEQEANRLATQGLSINRPFIPKKSSAKPITEPKIDIEANELIGDEASPVDTNNVSVPTMANVIEEARGLGLSVEEREEDGSRRIWIKLLETPDTPTRLLVWRLLQQGFKFWPQKGYWK